MDISQNKEAINQPEGQTSVVIYKEGKPIIHVIGGADGPLGDTPILNYSYNPENKTINTTDIQFQKLYYPKSVSYKNNIYCLGGNVYKNTFDVKRKLFKEEFNPDKNISSVLNLSHHMASCVVNDNLYITGGYIHGAFEYIGNMGGNMGEEENRFFTFQNRLFETERCYRYSFERNNIEEIASFPTSLYNHSMVSIDNKLYVIGGCSSRLFLQLSTNNILMYDTEEDKWANKWVLINPLNYLKSTPRHKHCSVVCNNKIYTMGGVSQTTVQTYKESEDDEDSNNYSCNDVINTLSSVECFDPKTRELSYVEPLPYALSDMTAVTVKMTKTMIRNEITSKPDYNKIYNSITNHLKDPYITDIIFEYIISEKIYVFKGQTVLSYIPEFNQWVKER
jgi:N-acetylneuraminic acid mutarotase